MLGSLEHSDTDLHTSLISSLPSQLWGRQKGILGPLAPFPCTQYTLPLPRQRVGAQSGH